MTLARKDIQKLVISLFSTAVFTITLLGLASWSRYGNTFPSIPLLASDYINRAAWVFNFILMGVALFYAWKNGEKQGKDVASITLLHFLQISTVALAPFTLAEVDSDVFNIFYAVMVLTLLVVLMVLYGKISKTAVYLIMPTVFFRCFYIYLAIYVVLH